MDLGFLRRRHERRPYAANSTGRYRGSTRVKGIRTSFYEAIGPARREFDERIKEAIVSHINDNSDKLPSAASHLVLSLFMVGHSEDRTKPVIMFVSEDKVVRREAFRLIKDSGIMREFRGFTLGEMTLKAEFEDLKPLGSEPTSTVILLRGSRPTSFGVPDTPIRILGCKSLTGNEVKLELRDADPSTGRSSSAMSGGVVSYKGSFFCQTVNHFHQPPQPKESIADNTPDVGDSDDECEIMDLSDSEDEDDRLARITSRASETPPATQSDYLSATDSPSSQQYEDAIFSPGRSFEASGQRVMRESSTQPQPRPQTPETSEQPANPSFFPKSSSVTGEVAWTSPYLDTSLIRVDSVSNSCGVIPPEAYEDHFGGAIPLERYKDYVEDAATDAAIKVTTSRGEFSGMISGTPSLTCLPGSKTLQEVYTAKIDEPLIPGDCGCWIKNAATGKLFGHVIAGSPTTGLVLVMPAKRVFSQLLQDVLVQDNQCTTETTSAHHFHFASPLMEHESTASMPSLWSGFTESADSTESYHGPPSPSGPALYSTAYSLWEDSFQNPFFATLDSWQNEYTHVPSAMDGNLDNNHGGFTVTQYTEIYAAQYPEPPTADSDNEESSFGSVSTKHKIVDDNEWRPSKRARLTPQQGQEPLPQRRPRRKSRTRPLSPDAKQHALKCRKLGCDSTFQDQASLEAHIRNKHARPFTCVFHFAGCGATFSSKNEWKRHVSTQHLLLDSWVCQEGECSKLSDGTGPNGKKTVENGAIFNRKDLYTRHMRRMHMPESLKDPAKSPAGKASSTSSTQWEEHLRQSQDRAIRRRCRLPEHMRCPAVGCGMEFNGSDAWDQRMEHVARHLDRAAKGHEPEVQFGGEHDESLVWWASQDEVRVIVRLGERWVLASELDKSGPREKGIRPLESTVPRGKRKDEGVTIRAEEEDVSVDDGCGYEDEDEPLEGESSEGSH